MGAYHDFYADGDADNVPLTDAQRTVVIIVHYLAFVVGGWNIWAYLRKVDTLRNRIWGPFVLLLGLIWLQVGSALEIGNHYYEGDWELAGFPSDLINGTFYFFNFGAQYLNALGLRKNGISLLRRPNWENGCRQGSLDLLAMVFDVLMIVGLIITAPLYAALGRDSAISVISGFGAFAGFGTLFRLWKNLGPNRATLWGGILFLALALTGVIMTSVYRSTGLEWLHIFIGGSFVASLIPFTIAILYSQEAEELEEMDVAKEDNNDATGTQSNAAHVIDEEGGLEKISNDGFVAEGDET